MLIIGDEEDKKELVLETSSPAKEPVSDEDAKAVALARISEENPGSAAAVANVRQQDDQRKYAEAEELRQRDREYIGGQIAGETGIPYSDVAEYVPEDIVSPLAAAYSVFRANTGEPLEEDAMDHIGAQMEAVEEVKNTRAVPVYDSAYEVVDTLERLADEIDVLKNSENGSFRWGFLPELVQAVVPFKQQVSSGLAAGDVFGHEDRDLINYIFNGQNTADIRARIIAAAPEERVRIAKMLQEAFINQGAKGLGEGHLEAWTNLLEVSDFDDMDDANVSKLLEDGITVLDALPLAFKAAKGGAKWLRMKAGKVAEEVLSSPALSTGANAEILRVLSVNERGSDEAASMIFNAVNEQELRALGMSLEETVDAALPRAGDSGGVVVADPARAGLGGLDTGRHIERFVRNENISQMQADAIQALNRSVGGRLHVNKSEIVAKSYDEEAEAFTFKGVFGKSKTRGFPTVDEAVRQAEIMFGVDADTAISTGIKWRDPKTGRLYNATSEKKTAGAQPEYFIEYEAPIYLRPKDVSGAGDSVFRDGFGVGWFRTISSWGSSSVSKFTPNFRRMGTLSVDKENVLLEAFARELVPYTSLSRKSHKRVDQLLRQGEAEGKVYSDTDLSYMLLDGSYLTAAEHQAYRAYRKFADGPAYDMTNEALRQKMLQANVKWVHNPKTGFSYAASPVPKDVAAEAARVNKVTVYNPETKTVEKLTRADINRLYDSGQSLAEGWRGRVEAGNNTVRYVLVSGDTQIYKLPRNVLRKEQGYIPRHYNTNFYVKRNVRGVNTVDGPGQTRTLGTAWTKSEAQEYADQMFARLVARAKKQGKTPPSVNPYYVEDARQYDPSQAIDAVGDVFEMEGMMFFQDRARRAVKTLGDGDPLENPYNAMSRNVQAIASRLGTGRVVEVLENKWLNTKIKMPDGSSKTWAEAYGVNGKLPPEAPKGASKDAARARAMYNYISLLKHELTPMQKKYKDVLWNLAKRLDPIDPTNYGSRALYWAAKTEKATPWAVAKNLAFTTQILMAPLRQAYIQSHQALFLTGIDPMITPRTFTTDAMYLNAAFLDGDRALKGKSWKRALSKVIAEAGQTFNEKEMSQLAKQYENSGLPILRAQVTLEDTSYYDNAIMHALGEIGYAAGERHNLAASYAFAYRKYLKDTDKTYDQLKKKDWDEIAFKAREYALSMTRADAFAYQRGALSAATQYLAIRHKTLQAFMGSDTFTGKERMRMGVAQTLLFGAEGLGLGYASLAALEKLGLSFESEQERILYSGGLYDLAANYLISEAFDGYNDPEVLELTGMTSVEFSKSMSALGGTDLMLLGVTRFVLGNSTTGRDVNVGKLLMGPGFSTTSKISDTIDRLSLLAGSVEDFSNIEPEIVWAAGAVISQLSSGSSAASKALMGRAYNLLTTTSGDPITYARNDELWVKGVLGFTTYSESEYYHDKYINDKTDSYVNDVAKDIATIIKMAIVEGDQSISLLGGAMLNSIEDDVVRGRVEERAMAIITAGMVMGTEAELQKYAQYLEASNQEVLNAMKLRASVLENKTNLEYINEMIEATERKQDADE